ncbi:hypothetical protein ACS0TY_007469 [Phlomoides rotata]
MGEEFGSVDMMKEEKKKIDETASEEKTHFVLIHGISGGAWCWYKLRCLLENSGYRVSCLDLKGCGVDQNDPNTLLSFNDYNQPLIHFLSSLSDNHQVILVGHSAGGLCLSDAIIKFGKKRIKLAIFVAATMLKSGFATDQDIKDGVPDLSEFGEVNEVYEMSFGLGEDCPPTTILVKKELQRKILYQLSPQEVSLFTLLCCTHVNIHYKLYYIRPNSFCTFVCAQKLRK